MPAGQDGDAGSQVKSSQKQRSATGGVDGVRVSSP